ncbi:MAG: creatininase family protein, partial [Desulfobacterales bacterium]
MAGKIDRKNIHKNEIAEGSEDSLSALAVFDRLEVGPVKLESKRLTAPYHLYGNGQESSTELIYSYEENVFDPAEPESQNLADMIAAQAALNYGLFCRRLIFHGRFDDIDRRFLNDAAENTAREIYVKKFLEPNPFLVGDAARLPVVKKKKYLQATLSFPSRVNKASGLSWKLWTTDKNRHCILSSGGKDSLLSFGLLSEVGCETHPVFVNESGRHWFTALNAYRYFKETVPNTARVWVNCDRLFTWMLRRMPFIRQNFADIRADIYPIRLWTVAVFLFGALPLLRKRGIGRLIIGDEYDTTARKTFQGITHYDGLYDQSIYFDHAMSRYFMRKGWSVSQFSILRPLSELLIEKTLAHRYPHLQKFQISCHAAHQEGEHIVPCGKCEKCRRIVTMLMALGKDPQHCGYRESQIADCLNGFVARGVSQEIPAVQQLGVMLAQKGLIDIPEDRRQFFTEQPEILKLRFDDRNSPLNAIPVDLRIVLLRKLLE